MTSGPSSTASLISESTRAAVALGDQQGPGLTGRLDGEAVPVDQADAGGDRIDPEAGPGQVEERQAGHDLHLDPGVGRRAARTVRSATSGEPGTA